MPDLETLFNSIPEEEEQPFILSDEEIEAGIELLRRNVLKAVEQNQSLRGHPTIGCIYDDYC